MHCQTIRSAVQGRKRRAYSRRMQCFEGGMFAKLTVLLFGNVMRDSSAVTFGISWLNRVPRAPHSRMCLSKKASGFHPLGLVFSLIELIRGREFMRSTRYFVATAIMAIAGFAMTP